MLTHHQIHKVTFFFLLFSNVSWLANVTLANENFWWQLYLKLACACVLSPSVMSDSVSPHELQPISLYGIFHARCWGGFPFTSPGDLPIQELTLSVKPPVLAGRFFTTEPPEKRWYLEFRILVRKILWRRELQSTPVFLPGESQGQRSLAGYSPWTHKVSDTTE